MGLQKYDPRHKPPEQIEKFDPYSDFEYRYVRFPGVSTSKGDLPTARHWTRHYFNNKSPEWWLQSSKNFDQIIDGILPEAINHIVRNNMLTSNEGDNLKRMIVSPDPENFMVAIMVIIKYKKEIIKLKRHAKI